MSNINVTISQETGISVDVGENTQAAADSAALAAQAAIVAQALSGPLYSSIAAGLAATDDGEEFAVDEGDGTATIYLNNSGLQVLQRVIIIAPAADGTSAQLGHTRGGTGTASRTVAAKLNDFVSPEDFTGTDTQKIQAALDTNKSVKCTAATYSVTGTITMKASGQSLNLNGALVTATGNFDVFEAASGIQGAIIENGRIEAAAMTGGYIFDLRNTDRLTIRDLRVFNPFNFAYIQQANVVEINNVWVNNIRGDYGIRWYGTTSLRSDILRLIGVNLSFPGSGTGVGIDWDGNCHTLQAWGVTIVAPNKGVVIRNSSGGALPEFGFFTNIEIDFPESYGVEILAGESYYFGPQFYCHGSDTASGVYIASAIPDDRVAFYGGKISGHATYGIENNKRVLVANLLLANNTTANYLKSDEAITSAPRIEIDGTYLFRRTTGGDPVLQFDASDFIGYNRSANDLFASLSGSTRMQVSASNDAMWLMVNGTLKQVTQGAANSGGTGFRVLRVAN